MQSLKVFTAQFFYGRADVAFSIRRRELALTLRRLCNRSGYQGFYVAFSEMRYRNRCFSFALGGWRRPPMENPNRPILIIAAAAGLAVVLMLWALYGTNGPTSLDASKKPSQTTGSVRQ